MEHVFNEKNLPERPLECAQCRKPIQVIYTEVVGRNSTRTSYCAGCPVLRSKLYGSEAQGQDHGGSSTVQRCAGCGLMADDLRMGAPLGCQHCYEFFAEEIMVELVELKRVSHAWGQQNEGVSMHVGRAPGKAQELAPALKIVMLQQALRERLGKEDYEQAAWIRDQIKSLEERALRRGGASNG